MASPRGIFRNLNAVQLQAKIDAALLRIENGDRTSVSGGGKSGSKNYPMSPDEILFEAQYSLDKLNGTSKPSRTYFDVREIA
jgi:hypothetical protein